MHYLRALGYRLPDFEQTGSNFGADLEHETPFGIDIGRGTMIADGATLIDAGYSSTSFRVTPLSIGPRNFLGNAVAYPAGGRTGENCLIATKAMVPLDGPVRANTGLLGSPCFEIPRSVTSDDRFDHLRTGEEFRRRLRAKNRHNLDTMGLFLAVRWVHAFVITLLAMATWELGVGALPRVSFDDGDDRAGRGSQAGGQVLEEVPELQTRQRVYAGGRLVQEQRRRSVQQRADQGQLLLHPAGQLAGQRRAPVAQSGKGEQLAGALCGGSRAEPVEAADEAGVLLDGQVRVEVEALLGESQARLARPAGQDASRVDPQQAGDAAEQGGLAGAVGSGHAPQRSSWGFAVSESDSPGTYISAITGELVLGGRR